MEIALGLLGTILAAVIAVIGGLWAANRQTKTALLATELQIKALQERSSEEKAESTLDLFRTFRFAHLKEARRKALRARHKWYTEPRYRARMKGAIYNDSQRLNRLSPEEVEEFDAIHDMIEFYTMLALHRGNDEEIKAIGFYYTWWRGFLQEIRKAHEDEYKNLGLSEEERAQFPPPQWINHLNKFEQRLGLPEYKQEKHPLDKHFLNLES